MNSWKVIITTQSIISVNFTLEFLNHINMNSLICQPPHQRICIPQTTRHIVKSNNIEMKPL